MDLNITMLKDAGEALDKIMDAVSKFAKMIGSAAGTASEIIEWNVARNTRKTLLNVSITGTYVSQTQTRILLPTLEEYIENPDPKNWNLIKESIESTLASVRKMSDELKGAAMAIATTEFFPVLVGAVAQRQLMLMRISKIPAPQTGEEIEAVKEFLRKYKLLVEQLVEANSALGKYIDGLKAQNKWPIRGD
jgi:hypothetical protein